MFLLKLRRCDLRAFSLCLFGFSCWMQFSMCQRVCSVTNEPFTESQSPSYMNYLFETALKYYAELFPIRFLSYLRYKNQIHFCLLLLLTNLKKIAFSIIQNILPLILYTIVTDAKGIGKSGKRHCFSNSICVIRIASSLWHFKIPHAKTS